MEEKREESDDELDRIAKELISELHEVFANEDRWAIAKNWLKVAWAMGVTGGKPKK